MIMNIYLAYFIVWVFLSLGFAAFIDEGDGFKKSLGRSLLVQLFIALFIGAIAAVSFAFMSIFNQ